MFFMFSCGPLHVQGQADGRPGLTVFADNTFACLHLPVPLPGMLRPGPSPGAQIQARSRRSQLPARYCESSLLAAAALPAATTRRCVGLSPRSLVPMSLPSEFWAGNGPAIHHACTTRTWETRTSPRAVRPQSKTPLPEAPRRLRWGAEREETYHFHAFRNIKSENSADTFARGLAKRNLIGEE